MFSKSLFVLAALALAANAQSTTATSPAAAGTGATSPCVIECATNAAAQNGCNGPTDLACVCTNLQFQSDAGACLQAHCSPSDIQAAEQLQQAACGAASLSPSSTVTPTPKPVSFTSIAASATSGGSTSAASKSPTASAASGTSLQTGAGAFFGAILAAVLAL